MKILQISNHFYPCTGGVEKHIEGLCENLIARGHECDVLCLNRCPYGKRLRETETYKGINIYRVPYLDLKLYKIAPFVFKFIKNYDVLHVHGLGFFADFLALTKFVHGKPLVLSTHGGIFHTSSYLRLKRIYFYKWAGFVLKRFDNVIAKSKNDEELFSRIGKVVHIPYAIDIDGFRGKARRPEEGTFIYLGRISRNKRIDNLIRTMGFLKHRVPDLKLYIVGADWGGIRKELEVLIREMGLGENVVFAGEAKTREEVLKYFARSKYLVSASEYEGFGISVLEAMAAGLVVIVNDIDAFRNFVVDGKNGFLVNYFDPEEASTEILEIMNKDSSSIRENAKKTAASYGWGEIVKKIEGVYEEAIRTTE